MTWFWMIPRHRSSKQRCTLDFYIVIWEVWIRVILGDQGEHETGTYKDIVVHVY